MDPRSEVVLRQQDYLKGRLLLINAPNDALVSQLPTEVDASIWTWNYADYQGFVNAGTTAHFSVEFPSQEFDQAIIFVPKSKELLNYILHVVMSHLKTDQSVFLVGEKKVVLKELLNNYKVLAKFLNLIALDIVSYGI